MTQNLRKWLGLLLAVACYYLLHEGAHWVVARLLGTFQHVRFARWGLGVQIVTDTAAMSAMQLFVFGIAGAVAALLAGYALVWQRKRLLRSPSRFLRASAYYATMVLLFLDPFYLSVMYRFVGGGDMNAIVAIGVPETAAALFFLALLALNLLLFARLVYPAYKARFLSEQP